VNCVKKQPAGKGRVGIKDLPWNFCWDFLSDGGCRKGAKCKWIHQSKADSGPPAPPQHKLPWSGDGKGIYQYPDGHQVQQDIGQLQLGVGQLPYDKARNTAQLAPTLEEPSSKDSVPNSNLQPKETFLNSPSSRAKGFIPRVNAKEFLPTGKYQTPNRGAHFCPSKTALQPQYEQLGLGTQMSNLQLSSDHQTNLFGTFPASRKSCGASLSPPSSSQNTGFSNQIHSSLAQWSGIPMGSQGFQKLPMQNQGRFSTRRAASMPPLIRSTNDMIPYSTPEGSTMFLPRNTYLPQSATHGGYRATIPESYPQNWKDGEDMSTGQFLSRESHRPPKSSRLLLNKNLRRDQDHRHTLYLNALSRAGLVPKSAWPSVLTGSADMAKLSNSRAVMAAAVGGGTVNCSNQKKNTLTGSRRSELTRKAVKLHNSNLNQKFNLLNSGFMWPSAEMVDQRGDSGPSKVSYASNPIEKGDTTGCPVNSGRTPLNVFSPPFKVPEVKSHQACYRRSRGARSTGTLRGWPPNSAPATLGQGNGGNDPEKLMKFLKRGENFSSERLRGSRRGGYSKSQKERGR